jgi:hypothetical protein
VGSAPFADDHSASTIKLRVDADGSHNAMSPLIPLESALPVSGSVVLVLGVIGVVCLVAVKVEPPVLDFLNTHRSVKPPYLVHYEGFQGPGMRR